MSGAGFDDNQNSFLASCLVLPANLTENELPPLEIGVGNLTVSLGPNEYVDHYSCDCTRVRLADCWVLPQLHRPRESVFDAEHH